MTSPDAGSRAAPVQASLFDVPHLTPAQTWEEDAAKRALDELFSMTIQYRSSKAYSGLLRFVARFRFYSPFNAMLVHIQMPGATFVAPPHRWIRDYGRAIKVGARPLVILQPMGPVMFVFDVSDTEGRPLPPQVMNPFATKGKLLRSELGTTIQNAKRDGILIHKVRFGSQQGGAIRKMPPGGTLAFEEKTVPLRYELVLKDGTSDEESYVTLAHELAHLYCGHLGTPNDRWWPDRRGLEHHVREFEAESVAYLVCRRLGLDCPAASYLAGYVKQREDVPSISLDLVMKAAGLIESMGHGTLAARKSNGPG